MHVFFALSLTAGFQIGKRDDMSAFGSLTIMCIWLWVYRLHPAQMQGDAVDIWLLKVMEASIPVSYTHLDVYKRQIIYSSDTLAVGGAHILNRKHIAIPEQIMLICFNNSASACDCYPQLSSIDNNINEAGKAAAQLMLQMINREDVEDVLVPGNLVIREST